MVKAILFDMDGLMIDSERLSYELYKQELDAYGIPFDESFYHRFIGKTKESVFSMLQHEWGTDFPLQEMWDKVHILLDEKLTSASPYKKGLLELLTYLNDKPIKLIIATSSEKSRMESILQQENVLDYFDDAVCGDAISHSKPHPEIFLKALAKAGCKKEEALILEDSEAGIDAGNNAGIPVICIPDMKMPDAAHQAKCIALLTDLEKVIDYLEGGIL